MVYRIHGVIFYQYEIKTLKFILSVFLGTTKASQQVPVSVSDPA